MSAAASLLLVDDDRTFCDVMRRALTRRGFRVTLAHGVTVSSDSRYAFVSVEGKGAQPGKVEIFDLTSFTKAATVDVGQQASGITFWKMEPVKK